ncbi:maleylpyruvate isomerase N-terminal domain-containing protein [Nocardioides sp. cx-173]|uniref:maleylpyruvate isomerase N-terminal domain-containing protein n=1 Tax=Nocardioides sp. cx-173 TaxID=2898796 RepID=UPI001E2FC816|nr:maleylpyruvate isomerase N-terminal domain-containing protein [Nocardioides sp. cx-173]MCD4525711.1 maleylpyruvate isomerase N-terminal domain-containing protein [Nocardioides sp. cx-173]UGB43959.1 maleylpyruvate isomerase N-terminal domain-containing protein [Nocardioides sp. cx-173]
MGLTVALEEGRTACAESIEAFVRAVDAFSEYDLLDVSRCHGWTRLDVAVHVLAGWQEMLGGLVSVDESEPTVDAATYWSAFATQYATDDPVPTLMSQRRRSAAYARPSLATAQLHDVSSALMRGVQVCQDRRYLWEGHVFTAGDFLTVWAVEVVVHQLDLLSDEPAPASALRLARATIEALADQRVPTTWTDLDATLIGTGRAPVPPGSGVIAGRLPAFG